MRQCEYRPSMGLEKQQYVAMQQPVAWIGVSSSPCSWREIGPGLVAMDRLHVHSQEIVSLVEQHRLVTCYHERTTEDSWQQLQQSVMDLWLCFEATNGPWQWVVPISVDACLEQP